MVVGAIATNVAVLQGNSSVMFTSYPPMMAKPHFYLGLILFAVGALIGCGIFFATLVIAKEEGTYRGLDSARDLRRADRGDHRGVHHRLRRDHPDPDLAMVARADLQTSIP